MTINRDANKKVDQSFTMSGHADFAEHGQDLVCAGASAVSFGAINAIYVINVGLNLQLSKVEMVDISVVRFQKIWMSFTLRKDSISIRRNGCFTDKRSN